MADSSDAFVTDDMPDALWHDLLDSTDPASRALLANCQLTSFDGSHLNMRVPNEFTRSRIDHRLRERIEEEASKYYNTTVHLTTLIDENITPNHTTETPITPPAPEPISVRPTDQDEQVERLNPKYTFETFVIGPSNRFAHAAAVAVAESPGKSYNPLMIYGASGLGKTHLLHAIGHYIHEYHNRLKVKYVSTEEMTNDFINAISDNQTAHFRSMYREVDVLLIDEIQFLESKIQTQEEFFHTFNTLHNAQKQIVMTSDRPPKMLEALEPRLRSRFEWGLIADIQPADLETRIAILRKKAAAERLTVAPDVLEFIASKIQANIRELEGALIRVTAFASLNGQPVNLPLAEIVLKDLIADGDERLITPAMIMSSTAHYFTLTLDDLTGSNRTANIALARQVAMYLCRDLTELSLPKIGALFGRDHTTVMHAYRKISDMMVKDRGVFTTISEITSRLKQQTS
ncbi:MAG: chromosomal replication initiator protein DnaA [Propionibacteriaceae bacterium]|jgi:chromosomal replication initiator protein|nr:chromosomal replication initiator protein DnaA [Propionibacteriaceae bacterium]